MGFAKQETGVGSHFLLKGIFQIQGSNPHLHVFWISGRFFNAESPGKHTQALLAIKADVLGTHLPGTYSLGGGVLFGAQTPHSLWRTFAVVTILLFSDHWPGVVHLDYTASSISHKGFPVGSVVKNLPENAGYARDMSLIPRLGRSPREGNGPLQYPCPGDPMDRGIWCAITSLLSHLTFFLKYSSSLFSAFRYRCIMESKVYACAELATFLLWPTPIMMKANLWVDLTTWF